MNTFKKERSMYIVVSYLVYLAVSLGVTVWVAKTLHRSGRVFLLDAFQGNGELADSVNHLLVVGFYLINVGYVTLAMRTDSTLSSARGSIELVCDKIGVVLLVLGLMHFFNLYVFNRLRKRGKERERTERARFAPEPGWAPQGAPIGKVLD
jgi:hypothetical protein